MPVIGHGYDDNVGAPAFRNVIINGGFDVWQRGTSFTAASLTSPYYTVDRWITVRGGLASGATWSRQTSDLTGFNYFMRCQRDSGNTGTANIHASTSFETVNIKRLQGKQLTLSFWAKAGANYSATSNALKVQIAVGTGTDSNYLMTGFTSSSLILDSSITLTTSWQRFTLTTSSALLTTQNQLAVNIFSSPTGTAGAADYFDITGVQLEAGSVATPFEFEPYETTLRKCQRYYYPIKTGTSNSPVLYRFNYGGYDNVYHCIISLPVSPRITSGISFYDIAAGNRIHKPSVRWDNYSAISAEPLPGNDKNYQINITPSTNDGASFYGIYLYGVGIIYNGEL